MDTKELSDVSGGILGPPFPVVHDHLLCLAHFEEEIVVLAAHCQVSDLLPVACLIVVSDQAVMCEQGVQEGTKHSPLRTAPVHDTNMTTIQPVTGA